MIHLIRLLIMLLPPSVGKNRLLQLSGYRIATRARIMPCLLMRVEHMDLAEDASIGIGNTFRDLRHVQMGEHARIGHWNWISAARPQFESGAPGKLSLGRRTSITSRHYLDATGGIKIGHHTIVAGCRSTFITHAIDTSASEQSFASIEIGHHALLSSNIKVAPGAVMPDRAVLAMGGTLVGNMRQHADQLLAGTPARPRKPVSGYFFERLT